MKLSNGIFTLVSTVMTVFSIFNISAVKPDNSTDPPLCDNVLEIRIINKTNAVFIVNSQCNTTIIAINGCPVYEGERTLNANCSSTTISCNNRMNSTFELGNLKNTNYTVTINNTQNDFYFCGLLIWNDNGTIPHQKNNSKDNTWAVVIAINVFILFASIFTLIFIERSRRRSIHLKNEDNTDKANDKEMTHFVNCEESDSNILSCPSVNNAVNDTEQSELKPRASHYVSDDGLLYVMIGDIEKQTTRTSAGSVKSKRERVQYQEIDFTKTGQMTITETANTDLGASL